MNLRVNPPSPRTLSIIFGVTALICLILMVILLRFGHNAVASTSGPMASPNTVGTSGAQGILISLAAFVFGIAGVVCAVFCALSLLQSRRQ